MSQPTPRPPEAEWIPLPRGSVSVRGYDLAGNLVYETNFKGIVLTNQYEVKRNVTFDTPFGESATRLFLRILARTSEATAVEIKSTDGAMNRTGVQARKQFGLIGGSTAEEAQ